MPYYAIYLTVQVIILITMTTDRLICWTLLVSGGISTMTLPPTIRARVLFHWQWPLHSILLLILVCAAGDNISCMWQEYSCSCVADLFLASLASMNLSICWAINNISSSKWFHEWTRNFNVCDDDFKTLRHIKKSCQMCMNEPIDFDVYVRRCMNLCA